MFIKFSSMLVAIGLLLTANAAATPITFQMSAPNASGVNNLVPFTNQTVAITVLADTSQVIPLANLAGGGPATACQPTRR
jgi:hypothetical protein